MRTHYTIRSMGAPNLSFDDVATVFADYGLTVRGYVRYKLTQRNLEKYTKGKKLRVLDVGGGSGPDAGWLAHQGHKITLIEPSEKQREYAQRRFNFFLPTAARKRISIEPCKLEELESAESYDLVLVHGVAMYQSDPAGFIAHAASFAKSGGLVSIVEKGFYGAEARAIRRNDFEGLRKLRTTRMAKSWVGEEVWTFHPQDLENIITQDAKSDVLEWSGIRLITDEMTEKITKLKTNEVEAIMTVETELGHSPELRHGAQLYHFITKKR